jgi:hypothetical protein
MDGIDSSPVLDYNGESYWSGSSFSGCGPLAVMLLINKTFILNEL